MRTTLTCAALLLALGSGPALAQSGELTIWSWNIAASSLKATVEGFNKKYPDIKVTVQDLGNQPTYDKSIAGCAAGGVGLPDIVSIENGEAENYWSQFPDCFVDLHTLGYSAEDQKKFPDFKRTELEVGDKAYAMPWDSGPVAVFYRRDFYEKAGVDPASIKT
ncbi:MAG: carbohydrate ABC transporter substrate-binding protein, partial [Mesorhizobium sp.]